MKQELNIDYLSLAEHKFNDPKGVGALIVSHSAPVYPLLFGGSACNSNSKKPSHVLLALGLSEELAESAVRISLNQDNSLRLPHYEQKQMILTVKR